MPGPNLDEKLAADTHLSRKEAATFLRKLGCAVSHHTLRRWAVGGNEGRGPAFFRTRNHGVRYAPVDLEKWAATNTRRIE